MKKVALSLAGLLAAAAFAPEASALPVFARQTGMACSACHFQHFPILNGFGRSFKASGYTLMGSQGKVEGDDLSLPDRLNFGVLTTTGIEEQSGNLTATGNHNTIHVPGNGGELSLFFGGKVADNVGFLSEFGASAAPGMASAKLPMLFEVASGIRAGVVFLTTDGQGPAHSFEILNTGNSAVHMATPMPGLGGQHFMAASAAQYIGVGTAAGGASVVVVNPDMFFVNVGKYATSLGGACLANCVNGAAGAPVAGPVTINSIGGAPGNTLNTMYARAAYIFDAAGFNMGVGFFSFGGQDAIRSQVTQAQGIDFQMMGDVGSGMTLLLTAGYAKAPKQQANALPNLFNGAGVKDRTALTVNASVGFTPKITGIIGLRQGKSGATDTGLATGSALTDNAFQIGATYSLYQNVELSITNTRQSGSAWNAPVGGAVPAGQNATSLKMEALF